MWKSCYIHTRFHYGHFFWSPTWIAFTKIDPNFESHCLIKRNRRCHQEVPSWSFYEFKWSQVAVEILLNVALEIEHFLSWRKIQLKHMNKIFELLCLIKTSQRHLVRTLYQNRIAEKHEKLVYTERYEMYQLPINMAFQISHKLNSKLKFLLILMALVREIFLSFCTFSSDIMDH